MLYFVFVLFLITVFFLVKNRNSSSTRYLLCIMVSYTVALFSMMFYLAKDTYYYNAVNNLFAVSADTWEWMMFAPISQIGLIRILNCSCLLVLFFSIRFVGSFQVLSGHKITRIFTIVTAIILVLEMILYDPEINRILYYFLYPDYLSTQNILALKNVIHFVTCVGNIGIVIVCVVGLYYVYRHTSQLRIIKVNILGIEICYTLIMVSYVFMLGQYPFFLLKISKISNTVTFLTMPINTNTVIHHIFPIYLIIAFAMLIFWLYRNSTIKQQINRADFTLSKQIAAADTTSKVFCHYVKNEILAIQSEVETLEPGQMDETSIENIISRCENLYHRLDSIQRSTRASVLMLKATDMYEFIKDMITRFSYELKEYSVVIDGTPGNAKVMIDPEYFEQALHNVITNAIDAMQNLSTERKNLYISVNHFEQWVTIIIKDTGVGIEEKNIEKVFTPMYSSSPVSKHWGIGLSLTYKVIMAHEGHIEIESRVDYGTTVRIMLPIMPDKAEGRKNK